MLSSSSFRAALIAVALIAGFGLGGARAADQSSQPIKLVVDASLASSQSVVKTHEEIPVSPGPLTLDYPQWIPGEHAPVGPIQNVSYVVITANGQTIPWVRDPLNLYQINLTVPTGVNTISVDFTYLGATFGNYSSNRLSSPNLFVIDWNQNVMYPDSGTFQNVLFDPTLILPDGDWKFATALYDGKQDGNTVTWSTTSLERLLDSPLDACINFRQWTLWQDTGDFPGTATLNVCADVPQELDASDKTIDHFRDLVKEMIAMYGARHWHDYHFLLTLSDTIPGEGVEHHESSDDGEKGDYLTNQMALQRGGDLLSHEFNHSWDGKYRMPAIMYPRNPNVPFSDELLWVYEGMTQYYGDVMSYRDGIRDAKDWPNHIAALYANYDNEPGRQWRTLDDDATAGPFIYGSPRGYGGERRGEDFYTEGELMWLKVDSILRAKSDGKNSLDTFARAFFGQENTGPIVKTYTRNDIIATLNSIQPYDWAGFFHTWIDSIAPHPPDGFTADGWKLVYTDQPTQDVRANNFTYSIGLVAMAGQVVDVHFGSPAWQAGLGFGDKIVAVNGRDYSDELMNQALIDAKKTHQPIALIVSRDAMYRTLSIPYFDGPRYPHLVRIDGATDRLDDVIKSLVK